jgi:hypothetical protein
LTGTTRKSSRSSDKILSRAPLVIQYAEPSTQTTPPCWHLPLAPGVGTSRQDAPPPGPSVYTCTASNVPDLLK